MLCKRTHIIAVVQKSLVLTKRIDNLVKLFLKPVSYTHLDVYKRQAHGIGKGNIPH